jgi:hypothetical protein
VDGGIIVRDRHRRTRLTLTLIVVQVMNGMAARYPIVATLLYTMATNAPRKSTRRVLGGRSGPSRMDLVASVSRSSGLEKGGDA